jgi:Zn-finger nucleic acid-binding protein
MKCPLDGSDLVMTERQGIEIDYCPKCRGVWLDRGELDKIIDRAAGEAPQAAAFQQPRPQPSPERYSRRDDDDDYQERRYKDSYKDQHDPRYRKRRGFLGDLFDIGD